MSLTQIKKRSGPSTEPWCTEPYTIVSSLETVEPLCVDCVLHDKYEENQALIIPPLWVVAKTRGRGRGVLFCQIFLFHVFVIILLYCCFRMTVIYGGN